MFLQKPRGGFISRPAPGDGGHAEDEIGAADIGAGAFAVERRTVDATGIARPAPAAGGNTGAMRSPLDQTWCFVPGLWRPDTGSIGQHPAKPLTDTVWPSRPSASNKKSVTLIAVAAPFIAVTIAAAMNRFRMTALR